MFGGKKGATHVDFLHMFEDVEVELGDDGAAALRLQRAQLRRPLRRLPAQRTAPSRFSATSRHIVHAAEIIVSDDDIQPACDSQERQTAGGESDQ